MEAAGDEADTYWKETLFMVPVTYKHWPLFTPPLQRDTFLVAGVSTYRTTILGYTDNINMSEWKAALIIWINNSKNIFYFSIQFILRWTPTWALFLLVKAECKHLCHKKVKVYGNLVNLQLKYLSLNSTNFLNKSH